MFTLMDSYLQFHPGKIGFLLVIMGKTYFSLSFSRFSPLFQDLRMVPHFFHVFWSSTGVPIRENNTCFLIRDRGSSIIINKKIMKLRIKEKIPNVR